MMMKIRMGLDTFEDGQAFIDAKEGVYAKDENCMHYWSRFLVPRGS